MLLGEALIEASIISADQLKKAIVAQQRFPNHSLGRIIVKLFGVPVEIVETTFIKKVVLPFIDEWFREELAKKPGIGGVNLADMISSIDLDLSSYRRYEGEQVYFQRNDQGYYVEQNRDTKLEKISVKIDFFLVRTIRRQEVVLKDALFEVTLGRKSIRPENPGFVAEYRLKLLHAMKEK